MQTNWHVQSLSEVTKLLNTSPNGISTDTALQLLARHGKNLLVDKKRKTVVKMLLNQLTDFMIIILAVAAVISGLLGDITDTIIILAIIVLNATVGFIQEYRAQKAMEALKSMAASHARVLRDGNTVDIAAAELVPGDVVLLEAGNILPADVRFFETHQINVDESALTGESYNVQKNEDTLAEGNYAPGDKLNMGFKGTFVTHGRGLAYVTATGMNTELGRIASLIQGDETSTPLQKRLSAFARRLSLVILIICVVIFVIGWLRGEAILTMLLTAISLAVAAIPEALPALVTIALALGAKKLVKSHVLIRKLPAVETLGSVTYICSDKTGTLTLNKMTVQEMFEVNDECVKNIFDGQPPLLAALALNNDVTKDKDGNYIGDSTEVALVQHAFNNKADKVVLEKKFARVSELPFDSTRKCMSTLHKTENGILVITKGAIEVLLDKLEISQQKRLPEFEARANEMAEKGYRVLGYAVKSIATLPETPDTGKIESSLTLLGFAGMIDPPREEAKEAVAQCKQAGIIPVMITGDHQLTAKAIATQLGIITSAEDKHLSGMELAALTDNQFSDIVEQVRVYARVSPEQKLKIVSALQAKNQFVAMTGDGVNDAPALKNADIGIAMGINGTEVSKEAAHMILLNDNFATIVVAVKHGRRIFDNILKFIKYIMTGNSGEIWSIFLAPLFGLPIPLLAIHILWVNLITDGLPGLALAAEPAEHDIMKRPPRNPKQNIFAGGLAWHILWVGLLIGAVTLGTMALALHLNMPQWQTMAFTVLCFSQMGHVMAIRSDSKSLFSQGVFSNRQLVGAVLLTMILQIVIIYVPFFQDVFKIQALNWKQLLICVGFSGIVFWAVEFEKLVKRRWKRNKKIDLQSHVLA